MLLSAISAKLAEDMKETQLLLPYAAGSLLDDVHTMGRVVSVAYEEDGARVTAHVPRCLAGRLAPYVLQSGTGAESAASPAAAAAAAGDGHGSDAASGIDRDEDAAASTSGKRRQRRGGGSSSRAGSGAGSLAAHLLPRDWSQLVHGEDSSAVMVGANMQRRGGMTAIL
jgi:hypothetical protein